MSVDYSGLLACTYGTAAFELESYGYKASAIVKPDVGRTGTSIEVSLTGTIRAADSVALSAALAAAAAELNRDGQDLLITGLTEELECSLLAAQCLEGGPHVDFDISDGKMPLSKTVKITVKATQPPDKNGPLDLYTVTARVRPDGLREIIRTGEVQWVLAPDYFTGTVLPTFQAAYKLPRWVVNYDYKAGMQGVSTKVSYTLTARENFADLPDFGASGFAFDGTLSKRIDRDEQMRKMTVYEGDFVVKGDAAGFATSLRAQVSTGKIILKESMSIDMIRENRVKANFTILESGWHNPLMNWKESMKLTPPATVWEEKTYFGADPILVARPKTVGRIVQTGSAIGAGVYKKPAPAIFTLNAAEPEFTLSDLNDVEKETQFTSMQFLTDDQGVAFSSIQASSINPWFLARQNQDNNFYAQNPKVPNAIPNATPIGT